MDPSLPLTPRHLGERVAEALREDPVVLLVGARQCGKTTLAREIVRVHGGTFLTLDDPEVFDAARADPGWLLDGRPEPVVVDEYQRAPGILLAIKARVDRERRPGRFLLTGSTRFLQLPSASDSLAGRVALEQLWPFSQGEMRGSRETFVDMLFDAPDELLRTRISKEAPDYVELACAGGFPVAVARSSPRSRTRWLDAYVTTVTRRDALQVARIRRGDDLERLLRLAAARTATVMNEAQLAIDAGLKPTTGHEYLRILEAVFLVHRLPGWSTNLTSKVARHPKLHVADTGLAASLMGLDPSGVRAMSPAARGPLLETFVVNEVAKQLGWAKRPLRMFHFRDRGGTEVDIVLEARDARVAAIEVKSGTRVDTSDLHGLELLRDRLGERFASGVVLHTGTMPQPRGARLAVLPIETLWRASRLRGTPTGRPGARPPERRSSSQSNRRQLPEGEGRERAFADQGRTLRK